MNNPKKKRRIDDEVDFDTCIICQEETSEPLVTSISPDAYRNILYYVINRAKYGESDFFEAGKRLNSLKQEDLETNQANVHASCRKATVSKVKLERARARHEKALSSGNVSILNKTKGRPTTNAETIQPLAPADSNPRRISRSITATYDKDLCFFCQNHDGKQEVHSIQTENRGKQLRDFVQSCDNDLYKVYLSSAINPNDALSIDVRYHRTCWSKYVVRSKDQNRKETTSHAENETAAYVEYIHLIKSLLKSGKILSLDEAHETYKNILEQHHVEWSPSRKYVRQMLSDNIESIEFIRAFRRNESDRFCLSAAKVAAIETAASKSPENDMEQLFRCARIIRKDILEVPNWQFDGSLDANMGELVPTKLCTLLHWILCGVAKDLQTERRVKEVNKEVVLLAQQIMYHVKSDRQVTYEPKSEEKDATFRNQREYPLQVGIGLLAHQQMRSRSLIDVLHNLGVSVDYTRILRIETQLAQAVLYQSEEYDVYVPPTLTKGEFVFFSVDNSDFSEDTFDGKNTLHATALAVFQRKTQELPSISLQNPSSAASAKSKSLPKISIPEIEMLPCHVPSNIEPKSQSYALDTASSQELLDTAKREDLVWSVEQSLARKCSENPKIPTWAAYSSQISSSLLPLTTVAMVPLIAAPAHDWSTMLTVLQQAQKINTVIMGPDRKTVITFDLQLYEMAVKLQMHIAPQINHLIFRLGEMHTVMTSLRALGSSIEDSGLDDVWVEAGIYSSTTKHQILECKHLKRALTAHSMMTSALSDLHYEAFLHSEGQGNDADFRATQLSAFATNTACQEGRYDELGKHHCDTLKAMETEKFEERLHAFDQKMEEQYPMFKFVQSYMKFMACIWLFIRATRAGNWKLHLESLKALCKYFFAHDRLNYARIVPLYLAQMEELESSDPEIYHQFEIGNFCVNKNEIPFCAVGPDHAIEHVNKIMKIRGGLKGLTQQPEAMARWFLIAPELSRLASEAEVLVGSMSGSASHHHDLSDAVILRYNVNVNKLKDILQANNPFLVQEPTLQNILTKAVMPDTVKDAILSRDEKGQDLFHSFVDERIVNGKLSVWSPMKKAKIQTWKTACAAAKKSKKTAGVTALRDDRALFARFLVVVLSRPEIDLKQSISEFELSSFPRALFSSDGNLRHCTNKSKLLHILENMLPQPLPNIQHSLEETQNPKRVVIIDGMAVVQSMGKPTWVRTGKDLATHFFGIIDGRARDCDEVHVIFDRYDMPNSLKEGTRQFRQGSSKAMVYNISGDAVIDKIMMRQLLSSNANKEALAMFFASHIMEYTRDEQKTYVVTAKGECWSNKLSVEHLKSNHEEADTRMLLHAVDATERDATSIEIQSADTDVIVLALWIYKSLCKDSTLVVGTGGKRRPISLGPLYDAVGDQLVKALPGFHAFTGCDQTGSICGKAKVSCWNVLKKSSQSILHAFSCLGSSDIIEDEVSRSLELFICQLYLPSTSITTVKELRWFLFSKRQYTDEKLPPTQAALKQMIKRANYVTLVWKCCDVACPVLPSPTSHGWNQEGNQLQPIPSTLLPAPKAVLELVKCHCKGKCATMKCSCRKYNLKCTDMCGNCDSECENRGSEETYPSSEDDGGEDEEDLQI